MKGNEKFILVLDGIDKQREAGGMLLSALARLGEMVPGLTVIFIVSTPRLLPLQRPGVPYVQFPPYTRAEAIGIVARVPPDLSAAAASSNPSSSTAVGGPVSTEEAWMATLPAPLSDSTTYARYYTLFVTVVYDSLVGPVSRSLPLLRQTCYALWPKFLAPILQGEQPPRPNSGMSTVSATAGRWDFTKLMLKNRPLFQSSSSDTSLLVPRLSSFATQTPNTTASTSDRAHISNTPLLSHKATILLLSAYLASHTNPKIDILVFSRLSSSSLSATSQHRKKLKKLYHRRKLNFDNTPTKKRQANPSGDGEGDAADLDLDQGGGGGTPSKNRTPRKRAKTSSGVGTPSSSKKSTLGILAQIPHPFTLDRLFAICRAVDPRPVQTKGPRPLADSLMACLVELGRLRLVVPLRSGAAGGGGGEGADVGAAEGRWRVNVRRAFVDQRCAEWGIGSGAGDGDAPGIGAVAEWEI